MSNRSPKGTAAMDGQDFVSTKDATDSHSAADSTDSQELFIAGLNVDAVRSIAIDAYMASTICKPTEVTCSVVEPPEYGSYNVVYELRFSTGTRWIMRIPFEAKPTRERRNFIAYDLIASRTSIPMPKLHAYSLDCDNALGHPYMIMDFARGTRLVDVWYDKKWWTGARSKTNTLKSLARHMVELSSIEFDRIGTLERNDVTGEYFVAPFASRHELACLLQGPDYPLGPFTTQHEYLRALAASLLLGMPNPYSLIIELIIGTLPDARYDSAPFTLEHPDLDSQNVFIDDDTGEVSALIDWDGAAVVPRQLGALRYPSWLTVDWDPVAYEQYKDADRYDHADELHVYRAAYVDAIRDSGGDSRAAVTRNSHIMDAINIALTTPYRTERIVFQLGKLLCGSARLMLDLAEGIRETGWIKRDKDELIRMPEFIANKELWPEDEEDAGNDDENEETVDQASLP